jgi:hypothetical protein
MENLLKSTTNNPLLLSDFNFRGFSTSKNWIGYCERKEGYSFELVEEAILFLIDFFGEEKDVLAITSLVYQDRAEYDKDIIRKYGKLYTKFKKMGILRPFDEKFGYIEDHLPTQLIRFDFDFGLKNMTDLSRLIMSHGSVRTERCFFVFRSLNLAVYPHNNTGFGCIGLNDDKMAGIEFLEFCKKSENFKVVIK